MDNCQQHHIGCYKGPRQVSAAAQNWDRIDLKICRPMELVLRVESFASRGPPCTMSDGGSDPIDRKG